ncbi:MAG: hypothetical protein K2Y05_12715 [Hyphomicrobiaceae bacterium]|nr:hypothetical protein [Hyphomicrobiaceae bacterium]
MPGSFEFHGVNVTAPDVLALTPPYFYLECMVVDSYLDWASISPTRPLVDQRGRAVINEPTFTNPMKFKLRAAKKFMAWREKKIETQTHIYHADTSRIKMTESLWRAMDEAFPNQLASLLFEAEVVSMIEQR